jgi:hypothetical protein
MNGGITVNFGGRGLQDFCPYALGQSQHVDGPMDAGLGRLHRIMLVMDRRGWAGEIVDFIDLDIEREGDIVPDDFKMSVIKQMLDIATRAGEEIVCADHDGTIRQQALA